MLGKDIFNVIKENKTDLEKIYNIYYIEDNSFPNKKEILYKNNETSNLEAVLFFLELDDDIIYNSNLLFYFQKRKEKRNLFKILKVEFKEITGDIFNDLLMLLRGLAKQYENDF